VRLTEMSMAPTEVEYEDRCWFAGCKRKATTIHETWWKDGRCTRGQLCTRHRNVPRCQADLDRITTEVVSPKI